MFKINDYVVYKRNICIVKDVVLNKFSNKESYILIPIDDNSLKITVPVEIGNNQIRSIITKNEVEKIISYIPSVKIIEVTNDKTIENEYKKYLDKYSHENLIKKIKTTYLRNKERLDARKKVSDKDVMYFKMPEKLLYTEFSRTLNLSYEDTKDYVISKVKEISDDNEKY